MDMILIFIPKLVSEDYNATLMEEVKLEEAKQVVFKMKPSESLGYNCFFNFYLKRSS